MVNRVGLLLAALAFLAGGCTSWIDVSSDYDPSTNFTTMKTFRWMEVQRSSDDPLSSSLWENRVKAAVYKTLTAKGFDLLEFGDPDMLIAAHAGTKEKMNMTSWGYGYGGYWGPSAYGNISVSYYTETSLVLDIVKNPAKPELIWRGVGTGVVRDQSLYPEDAQERVNEAVAEIMRDFPPGRGK